MDGMTVLRRRSMFFMPKSMATLVCVLIVSRAPLRPRGAGRTSNIPPSRSRSQQ